MIRVRELKEHDFLTIKPHWRKLVARSAAVDNIFLSWAWQYSWWETWGKRLDLELYLLAAYDAGSLVGLAPLYIENKAIGRLRYLRRMQFIGNSWGRADTVRTEYLGFILPTQKPEDVAKALFKHLQDHARWDELVLCDIVEDESTAPWIKVLAMRKGWVTYTAGSDLGVRIDTRGQFDDYLKRLGPNTRLKLYNRRRFLKGMGSVAIRHESTPTSFFNILNTLHETRWGGPCFEGLSLDFHLQFLTRIKGIGQPRLSVIYLDKKPLSALYNVRVGSAEYNIQAGYIERFHKKLSLGTIHLGFAIENAFEDKTTSRFDLLAGKGKTIAYKARYGGEEVTFSTIKIVRNPLLKQFYQLYLPMYRALRSIKNKTCRFGTAIY